MEQGNKKKSRLWIVLLMLAVLLAGACGILFHFGGFRVEMKLLGAPETVVHYGESFEDPMVEAVFRGSYLIKEGMAIPVTRLGDVDTSKIGSYEIRYQAEFGFWSGEVRRSVRVVDQVRPKILLYEDPGSYVMPGEEYQEEGYLARDNYDGDLTDQVQITREHSRITYTVTDSSGNSAQAVREIKYYDPVPPVLQLEGELELTLPAGVRYTEPGYAAADNIQGDLTDNVEVAGDVNFYQEGSYILTYTVKDRYGNMASAERVVHVEPAGQPEIVTPNGKVIYLTFDDGPGPHTRRLLDVLKKYNVKATFFVVKTGYLDLVKDMIDEGHAVGIHTVSHKYREIYSSEEAYFEDLFEMQSLIEKYAGVKTTLVRFPGGSSNTVSRFNKGIMTRLTEALNNMGYQYFDWNVDSGDAGRTEEREEVVKNIIEGVKGQRVSVVLQHDIKPYSVDAVEDVILWALENGYRFLPLDPSSPNAHQNVRN